MGSSIESNALSDVYIRTENTSILPLYSDFNGTTAANISDALNSEHPGVYYIRIMVPVIFGLICVLGLFGNSLVILVVLFDKHMRNTTNILILSLAVADLLFILFCVPFTAVRYTLPVWPFGSAWCKISHYCMYVCAYASVYTLVIMSLDRYLAVVHAIRSMTWRSERNTWLVIGIIWFIILAGNIPILIQFEKYTYTYQFKTYNETRITCLNLAEQQDEKLKKVFVGCFFFFGYIIPLGITMLMYGLMLKRLLYGVVPGGGNQSAESVRAKKRVTRMVVIVIVIFAICWLPIQVIFFWDTFGQRQRNFTQATILVSANCLAYMNSCVNPILYAFLSDNFRRSFRKLLCCSNSNMRRGDYERTNIRFTVTEKEPTTKTTVVSTTYTPV